MRIIPEQTGQARPWIITTGTHALRLRLSPSSRPVRAGTPLQPSGAGWEACTADSIPWAFSADYKMPGDECMAWREATIDTGVVYGPPGTRLKIVDISDMGLPRLAPDPDGACVVLLDTYVLFIAPPVALSLLTDRLGALLQDTQAEPAPPPAEDFLNRPDLNA